MTINLALRESLYQSLLSNFLERLGYQVCHDNEINETGNPVISNHLHITDDNSSVWAYTGPARLIWLVDARRVIPQLSTLPKTVNGLLCSQSTLDELLVCLRMIEQGEHYISGQLLRSKIASDELSALSKLTPRERQIYALPEEGLSVRTMAEILCISEHTAENHRANIQRKLGLSGRLSLVRYAASTQLHRNKG